MEQNKALPSLFKPIILISGTSGIGKSEVAKRLFNQLNVDHRQTTGMIREVVAAESHPQKDPCLYSLSFESDDPIYHFITQAKRIEKAVQACIERCRREGSSLILEGNHLIPALYHHLPVDLFVVLTNTDASSHLTRIRQRDRWDNINEQKFANIRRIDEYLVNEAKKYKVMVIENDEVIKVVSKICGLLNISFIT